MSRASVGSLGEAPVPAGSQRWSPVTRREEPMGRWARHARWMRTMRPGLDVGVGVEDASLFSSSILINKLFK